MGKSKPGKVKDYMISLVEAINENSTVEQAIERLIRSRHHGFPVVDNEMRLVGFISAKEMVKNLKNTDKSVKDVIQKGTYTASPNMDIDDAARILFRYGLRDLPVIDENRKLRGMLSNLDVVRSHFERATPEKVLTVKSLIESKYSTHATISREVVPLDELKPTQWQVFEDELEGRKYEIEKGLAEPIVVIRRRDNLILVDGHHRVLAAKHSGVKKFNAIVLEINVNEELGMEKVTREHGVRTLDDVEIIRLEHHPLTEVTTQLLMNSKFERRASGDV